jgi:hypothetical protein
MAKAAKARKLLSGRGAGGGELSLFTDIFLSSFFLALHPPSQTCLEKIYRREEESEQVLQTDNHLSSAVQDAQSS